MKALVFKNKVVDLALVAFEVAPTMIWVDCSDDVKTGWIYDGSNFSNPETNPTNEELAFDAREQRDFLLYQSDWTQASDSPLTDSQKTSWATYRQSLRDISGQSNFPTTITWPTKP